MDPEQHGEFENATRLEAPLITEVSHVQMVYHCATGERRKDPFLPPLLA